MSMLCGKCCCIQKWVGLQNLLLKNPERQDVEMAIETLFSGRQKDDLVLLYFSGHD
jgi:hypothetical protein